MNENKAIQEELLASTTELNLELPGITQKDDGFLVTTEDTTENKQTEHTDKSNHTVFSSITTVEDDSKSNVEEDANTDSSRQEDTKLRRSTRTSTITANKRINTSDSNGNHGELNIKFVGRQKK